MIRTRQQREIDEMPPREKIRILCHEFKRVARAGLLIQGYELIDALREEFSKMNIFDRAKQQSYLNHLGFRGWMFDRWAAYE
jgi:hypothetical protein